MKKHSALIGDSDREGSEKMAPARKHPSYSFEAKFLFKHGTAVLMLCTFALYPKKVERRSQPQQHGGLFRIPNTCPAILKMSRLEPSLIERI